MPHNKRLIKILDISLTRTCNYNCSYCNQRYDLTKPMHDMSDSKRTIIANKIRFGHEWIEGLNNFPYKDDYEKIIFSGGEPSLHPDFFDIVSQVSGFRNKLIVSNLSFDVEKLIEACHKHNTHLIVQPSFHFEYAAFDTFLSNVKILDKNKMLSNFIPVSIVDLPNRNEPQEYKKKFKKNGFDASVYKFEGYFEGEFVYADIDGFGSKGKRCDVHCSSVCHNVRPTGDIVFCPTYTYLKEGPTFGNICDKNYAPIPRERVCPEYGMCHITSASWAKMRSIDSGETIWKGKNYRENNTMIRLRNLCEKRNFKGLGKAKTIYNRISSFINK